MSSLKVIHYTSYVTTILNFSSSKYLALLRHDLYFPKFLLHFDIRVNIPVLDCREKSVS